MIAPATCQGFCLWGTWDSEVTLLAGGHRIPAWTPGAGQHGCSHYVVREGRRAHGLLCGAHTGRRCSCP